MSKLPHRSSQDRGMTIQDRIRERLNERCPHVTSFRTMTFELTEGTLVLSGTLPTYYLKQLLQTALRDIDGVQRIVNRVQVVTPSSSKEGKELGIQSRRNPI